MLCRQTEVLQVPVSEIPVDRQSDAFSKIDRRIKTELLLRLGDIEASGFPKEIYAAPIYRWINAERLEDQLAGKTSKIKRSYRKFSQDKLLSIMAETAEWVHQEMNAQVWLIGTQYMDTGVLEDLRSRINIGSSVPLFTNRKYSHTELMGLLSELDLLIGMRTHSMILASSVGTPMIGIVNYPKTYGYLKRIGLAKQAIPIHELELEKLKGLVRTSWNEREAMGKRILDVVDSERNSALHAAELIAPLVGARDAVAV